MLIRLGQLQVADTSAVHRIRAVLVRHRRTRSRWVAGNDASMVAARARGAATAHGRRFDSQSATSRDRARLAHAHSPGVLDRAVLCQTAGDHAWCALCDHRHYLDIDKRISHTHQSIPSHYLRAVRAVEPLPTTSKTPALTYPTQACASWYQP